MTTSVRIVEVTMPPTIGAAIRCITSAPVPWLQSAGNQAEHDRGYSRRSQRPGYRIGNSV